MTIQRLQVQYTNDLDDNFIIGTLIHNRNQIFFEYAETFLDSHNTPWLSPFKLPPQSGLIQFRDWNFGEIWGLFDDSLPDGWGLLLMDRFFRSKGIHPSELNILDRLAYLGTHTMGALTYHPSTFSSLHENKLFDLFRISKESEEILEGRTEDILEELFYLGGSPAGARPKVLVGVHEDRIISGVQNVPANVEPWIIKFHSKKDNHDEGIIEFIYSELARRSGLYVPKTKLFFEPKQEKNFFGIKRFDRRLDKNGTYNRKVHMHSFGNLIHSNHRNLGCDYDQLLQITYVLTKKQQCVEKVFRQMIFNIIMNNRDDHAKNFAFLYENNEWFYAPSYDLTFSLGPKGEHSTTINGEGKSPSRTDIFKLGQKYNVSKESIKQMIKQIAEEAGSWPSLCKEYGVSKEMKGFIEEIIQKNIALIIKDW